MTDRERPAIRRATADDASALSALKKQTFAETFVGGTVPIDYSPENLARFYDEKYSIEAVTRELLDPQRAHWVAQAADGSFAAYAHAGPCGLPHPDATVEEGELYQIYVSRVWQGAGLGRMLLDLTFDWLEARFGGTIWIGVYSENHKAQAIYGERGFAKVGEYQFKVGDHRDHEFILKRMRLDDADGQ